MYYCDVERNCPQADGDEPAGDWVTSHNSVHDVLVLVQKVNGNQSVLISVIFKTIAGFGAGIAYW